jgi:transposase
MLPATLQFLIAMIACAINERMQRKLDYTQEEVRVLKEIVAALTGNGRISFTADQRRRLAVAGKALSPEERKKCCQIVKPGTILGWFRQMAARKYDSSESKVGRPRKKKDIRKLVVEMALANLGWGYTKIRDALRTGLKIEIGRTTVANILAAEGIEPAPEREKKRTWKRFMKSHWDTLCACDFFSVEALGITARFATWCSSSSRSRAAPSRSLGLLSTRRRVDEAGGSQFDRSCGWISARSKVPDPRSGPAVLEGIHRRSQSWGSEERENPSAEPQLQSVRGALREDHQVHIDTSGWPTCGEIDIMENIGKEPSTNNGSLHMPAAGDIQRRRSHGHVHPARKCEARRRFPHLRHRVERSGDQVLRRRQSLRDADALDRNRPHVEIRPSVLHTAQRRCRRPVAGRA